jgi:CheY-like chemotaxis protein
MGEAERRRQAFRVLVADDSHDFREMLVDVLAAVDCTVTCAADGLEALASLEAAPHDLLITDYSMPGLNGIALLRRIRTLHPGMPAILITGNISADLVEEAEGAGATMVLAKPLAVARLLSLVESIRARCSTAR